MITKDINHHTLQLKRPIGKTLILALIFFILLLTLTELLMRTAFVHDRLSAPHIGSRHWQLSQQLDRITTFQRTEGPLDCIFLGNSMVWRGIDVEVFEATYANVAQRPIRCFNFGIDALSAAGAGALAQILIEDYKPKLLIYGTDARDYAVPVESEDALVIMETPWIQYRLGQFSLDGLLSEYSYFYRYRTHINALLRFDYETVLRQDDTEIKGFGPDETVGDFLIMPPDRQSDEYHIQYYFELLSDYTMYPENLAGLEQIAALGTQLLMIEMPVPENYMYFFDDGRQDYERFINYLQSFSDENNIPFWQTTPLYLIPDDGWVDYSHLNRYGAGIFSEWLGQQVASSITLGR